MEKVNLHAENCSTFSDWFEFFKFEQIGTITLESFLLHW